MRALPSQGVHRLLESGSPESRYTSMTPSQVEGVAKLSAGYEMGFGRIVQFHKAGEKLFE